MKTTVLTAHEGHFDMDFNTVNPNDVIFNIFKGITESLEIEYHHIGYMTADDFDSLFDYNAKSNEYQLWAQKPVIVAKVNLTKWFIHVTKSRFTNDWVSNKFVTAVGFELHDVLLRLSISLYDVQHINKHSREDWVSLVAEFQERTYGKQANVKWSNRWEFAKRWYGENCIVDSCPEAITNESVWDFMKGRPNPIDTVMIKKSEVTFGVAETPIMTTSE